MIGIALLCGNLLSAAVRVLTVVALFGLGVLCGLLWVVAHTPGGVR